MCKLGVGVGVVEWATVGSNALEEKKKKKQQTAPFGILCTVYYKQADGQMPTRKVYRH